MRRYILPVLFAVLVLCAAVSDAQSSRASAAPAGATGATGPSGPTGPGGPPEPPAPLGNGPRNLVVVHSTVDKQAVTSSSVRIGSTRSQDVSNENLVWTVPFHCTECQGIGAALQVVFYKANPHTFEPVNLAVAVNTDCSHCGAFAYAYQYDVATRDGRVRLTGAAWRQIAAIREQVQDDVREAATTVDYATLDKRLTALATQLHTTVDSALSTLRVHENARRTQQHEDAHPTT